MHRLWTTLSRFFVCMISRRLQKIVVLSDCFLFNVLFILSLIFQGKWSQKLWTVLLKTARLSVKGTLVNFFYLAKARYILTEFFLWYFRISGSNLWKCFLQLCNLLFCFDFYHLNVFSNDL